MKFFPLNPLIGIVKSFIFLGSTLFSMPVFVPTQITSLFFAMHSLLNSIAGKTCPPVPAAEIKNFIIAKLDMNRLIAKVCELLLDKEENGILQTDVWKKLKLSTKDGSRLSLKMEKMGYITRQKILKNGRWTYTLFIEKAPISFESITDAPCLTCTVEQKCSLENELPEPSPRNCELIEKWVLLQYSRKSKKK